MGVRYQKYRSIAIPLNIGIELSQVSRYFDISNIEPALASTTKVPQNQIECLVCDEKKKLGIYLFCFMFARQPNSD